MRSILLLAGLLGAVHDVAAQSPEPALPDSTYLALTLELPVHGTFFVTRHAMRPNQASRGGNTNEQVRSYHYIDRVEVAGCRMILYRRNGGSPATAGRTDIPLKEIDLETLQVRQLPGATLELPPWEISAKAIDRSERPFLHSRRGHATTTSKNEASIVVANREQAERYMSLLADAANRCDTWSTSPIRAIR